MRLNKALIAALITAASAVPANATDLERAAFRLTAVVHTVCNVSFGGAVAPGQSSLIDLGNFSELCNDRNGFRITVSHGAELNGAEIMVDGLPVQLSETGQTVIVDENEPMERIQSMQLRVNGTLTEMPNLVFRIEPKGPRF